MTSFSFSKLTSSLFSCFSWRTFSRRDLSFSGRSEALSVLRFSMRELWAFCETPPFEACQSGFSGWLIKCGGESWSVA